MNAINMIVCRMAIKDEYNPERNHKLLRVSDDMIDHMVSENIYYSELYITEIKLFREFLMFLLQTLY